MDSVQRASEEVANRNIQSCVEHCNVTRKLFRETEKQVTQLKNLVIQQNQLIESQNERINLILQRTFAGGTSR